VSFCISAQKMHEGELNFSKTFSVAGLCESGLLGCDAVALGDESRCCKESKCLHLHGKKVEVDSLTLKMEAYQTT
jgi:hypothetical protein